MLRKVLLIYCVMAAVVGVKINDDRIDDLRKRIEDMKNHSQGDEAETRSEALKNLLGKIMLNKGSLKADLIEDEFLCATCVTVIEDFLNMRRVEKLSKEDIEMVAIEMCVDFEIQSEEVCRGIIELNTPSIIHIIDNRPDLSADTVCKLLLSDGDCRYPFDDDNLEFTIDIDNGTSIDVNKASANEKQLQGEDIIIVHITDIHVDFNYTKGASADCNEFACCREMDDVNESDPETNAGQWGDYRSCDTPWHAVVDAFNQIKRQHSRIDAIYFTGDIVDHFQWDTSVERMKVAAEKVYSLMSQVFGNVPVYPILGNHEAQQIFSPPDVADESLSVQWLYDHIAELWRQMLPPDALATVKAGGYYTTVVRPGLRLIALNNNVCNVFNWWILYETKSIQSQFQWLHDVLLAAEKAGEKVHILAHIPNGDEDYHQPCAREYRKIVDRFHKTIAAHFNGHFEFFNFNLFFYESTSEAPVSVAWNGGSLATFSGVNRNYIVYNVDPTTQEVKDLESWIYNLTAANQNEMQNPIWFRQFSLRDDLRLKDLSAASINNFVSSLPSNTSAIQQLWKMKIKDSDLLLKDGCSKSCHEEILCGILTADINDNFKCERLKKLLASARSKL